MTFTNSLKDVAISKWQSKGVEREGNSGQGHLHKQAGKGETSVSNPAEKETQRLKFSSLGNGAG